MLVSIALLTSANTIPRTLVGLLLPAIYRKQGLGLEWFWLFSLPLLVIPARVLWAPWVDRLGSDAFGRRKSWILPCTIIAVLTYLGLGFIPPTLEHLGLLVALLLLVNLALATQEIAVDAYVVEALHPEERGVGATARILAEETGQLLAIAGLMLLYQLAGWQVAISSAGLLFLVLTAPVLARPEVPVNRASTIARASLRDFLARRENLAIVAVIGAAALAPGLVSAIISPFLVDMGFAIGEIGIVLGLSSSLGPIIAGLTLVPWLRRGRSLIQAARLQLLLVPLPSLLFLGLALTQQSSAALVGAVIFVSSFVSTPALVLVYTARLGWASNEQAATDFTTQEAVYVLFRSLLPGAVAGPFAALAGWPGFFMALLAVSLAGFGSFVLSYESIEQRVAARRSQ
ncbi:MAG: MFS transporter [Pseudomonadota bacterium]